MGIMSKEPQFWADAFRLSGSATPLVLPRAAFVALFAVVVTAVDRNASVPNVGIEITPFEVAGAALGVFLVLRTNAGYDRWWEGRKLWGGIVNQSRNLVIAALSYGPADPPWRDRLVRRAAAFCHAARLSLRGQPEDPALRALLDPDDAARVRSASHSPSAVARLIGESLREGTGRFGMDGFALLRADDERARLIDHVGGCERIMKTPLPLAYRIEIRRFLLLFLGSLPFALVWRVGWLTPLVTFLVAFPLLAIDRIGTELQSPFATDSLNHLPLDDICATIENDLRSLAAQEAGRAAPADGRPTGPAEPEGVPVLNTTPN
jgi:putative membrane protein